jgi:hypothetical protein
MVTVTRWMLRAVQALPPVHRALDAWSQRRAQERRARRLKLAAVRQR